MATVTLLEAATRYATSLEGDTRSAAQAEVNRFVRWYGGNRSTGELRAHDVSIYGEELSAGTSEAKRKAELVRGFLAFLKKEGMTSVSLAPHLRVRKSNKAGGAPAASQQSVEVTAEGLESLKEELEGLKAQRPQVREEIRHAMLDKDFRENAPLDAAKEKQAHLESRIRDIEGTLRHAVIAEKPADVRSAVHVGSTVQVMNLGSGKSQRYTVVGANEGDAAAGKISNASPIGKALLGRKEGEEVKVKVPAGDIRLRVEKIEG